MATSGIRGDFYCSTCDRHIRLTSETRECTRCFPGHEIEPDEVDDVLRRTRVVCNGCFGDSQKWAFLPPSHYHRNAHQGPVTYQLDLLEESLRKEHLAAAAAQASTTHQASDHPSPDPVHADAAADAAEAPLAFPARSFRALILQAAKENDWPADLLQYLPEVLSCAYENVQSRAQRPRKFYQNRHAKCLDFRKEVRNGFSLRCQDQQALEQILYPGVGFLDQAIADAMVKDARSKREQQTLIQK